MTQSIRQAFLVAFLIVLASCSKESSPTDNDTKATAVILPLKVGNQWILQLTYSDTTRPGIDTMQITKDTLIQNERWFFIQDSFFGPNQPLLTNRPNGLWARNSQSTWLWLKYPASAGDSYPFGGDTMRVISVATSVVVPGGQFSCYQFRYLGVDWYLSPNVGFVRFPEFGVTDSTSPQVLRMVKLELLRAVLN